MARWIVFTDKCFLEVFLSPCCDFHYSSIPVCDAVPSKGPKITAIQYGFPALTRPLNTEIVPDSLNLWMILCTVDDDNFKLFAIFLWETPFWYCSTIFRRSIGGIGDPLPILTSERHCHSERLFLYPIMLPIDLISCKLVLQLFLCTFNFSGPLIATCPNFFGMCSSHEIQNEPIFGMTFQNVSLSTFDVIYILLWIKYKFMRFVNYCIPFYSQFVQCPNFFGIGLYFEIQILFDFSLFYYNIQTINTILAMFNVEWQITVVPQFQRRGSAKRTWTDCLLHFNTSYSMK